jgi:hypothetical protein
MQKSHHAQYHPQWYNSSSLIKPTNEEKRLNSPFLQSQLFRPATMALIAISVASPTPCLTLKCVLSKVLQCTRHQPDSCTAMCKQYNAPQCAKHITLQWPHSTTQQPLHSLATNTRGRPQPSPQQDGSPSQVPISQKPIQSLHYLL